MVDSTQMEKFEFDKSNQTYLGKNNNKKDKSNQMCPYDNVFRSSSGWSALWHPEMGSSRGWTIHVS